MKILIAEDDFASRVFMKKFLSKYGECDVVVDGIEAIEAYLNSLGEERKFDLICLDIMMPKVDGIRILQTIRDLELQKGIKKEDRSIIIMTTAMTDTLLVQQAFDIGCDAYAAKPIDTEKLVQVIEEFKLI